MSCPAAQTTLICFNAGGFPKQKCGDACRLKSADAQYTAAGTLLSSWYQYYGPFGHAGAKGSIMQQ